MKDDLDKLPEEKLEELKKYYKSLNVSGYEIFLNVIKIYNHIRELIRGQQDQRSLWKIK